MLLPGGAHCTATSCLVGRLPPEGSEVLEAEPSPTVGHEPWNRPKVEVDGGLAQLGERRVRNAEVEGSNPLPSTKRCGTRLARHRV